MSKELGYEQASQLAKVINNSLDCNKALAAPLKVEATKTPRPDLESTVMCKEKAAGTSYKSYNCSVVDGSICPLNLPINKVEFPK